MFGIDNISLSLNYNLFYLLMGIIILLVYTFYTYKHTIPQISKTLKVFLVFLRSIVLLLLLFLIFEPLFLIKYKEEIKPVNLIFADNSNSIVDKDSIKTSQKVNSFVNSIMSGFNGNTKLYSFGKEVKENIIDKLKFNEHVTNFNNVVKFIKNQNTNISSITIISDGIITDGINPINSLDKLEAPIYTIPLGDSTIHKDVFIAKANINEYLYTGNKTTIELVINNNKLQNLPVRVSFYENLSLLSSQEITLSQSGIDKVFFEYQPKTEGERKLSFMVANLKEDKNLNNNKFISFVKVLNSKLKILLLSSSPSPDVSFIVNSLKLDENFDVKLIQQISENEFLGGNNVYKSIDSCNILFIIGFPSRFTSNDLITKVNSELEKGKPCFLILSEGTDFKKLKLLEKNLPFIIKKETAGKLLVQPNIINQNSPLLSNNSVKPIETWNNLPPTYRTASELIAKPETEIIAKSKIQNALSEVPLILLRTVGKNRSIAVLTGEIWKWKLQLSDKNYNLFDRFFSSSVKWLNVQSDQKQLNVKTVKRVFALGEAVEFVGSAYDNTFNPIENAEITIKVKSTDNNYHEVLMQSIGNGLYEAEMQLNSSGNYNFDAFGKINNLTIGKDAGKFSVGELNIEKINLQQNTNLLLSYSGLTNGKMININNADELISLVNGKYDKVKKYFYTTNEIKFWSEEIILFIIIIIFTIEWFLRKKAGLL
ncbi:MAG: hypothetical protein V1773_10990 [bacterium]